MFRLPIDYQRSARVFGLGARRIYSDTLAPGLWKRIGCFCRGVAIFNSLRDIGAAALYDDGGFASNLRRGEACPEDTRTSVVDSRHIITTALGSDVRGAC